MLVGTALKSRKRKRETDVGKDREPTKLPRVVFMYTLIMNESINQSNARRNAHNAAFELKAIELVIKEGNRVTTGKLCINK